MRDVSSQAPADGTRQHDTRGAPPGGRVASVAVVYARDRTAARIDGREQRTDAAARERAP